MPYIPTTLRGYNLFEASSCLQKAIRRGETDLAGHMALELAESNYANYVWKRLLTISAEDCAGVITQEIIALHDAYLRTNPKLEAKRGRIFIAKAVLLLSRHFKSRDADHLVCLVHDQDGIAAERLDRAFMEARKRPEKIPLPEYTFDVHTARGRRKGKSKADFFREEFLGLHPKVQGEFDFLVEPQHSE